VADRISAGTMRGLDSHRLARELLEALDHIHGAGIVHRDVKPGNVLIADDGTAKLADFGIAQPEGATRLTSTGLVVGTRSYLAPEVARGEPATVRSDLYSCGMVLREAIGDQPSAALAELVTRLVDQDPARRPESASQALATLATPRRAARSETTAPTQPVAPERAITVGARAGQRGLPRPVVVMAILAVAIVLGLILLSGGDNRSSTGAGPASDRVGQEDRQQAPAEAQPEGAPAEPSKGKPKGKKPPKKTPPGKAKGRNKH
jgi:eukaryotic-like serine/threonine-protein kinase